MNLAETKALLLQDLTPAQQDAVQSPRRRVLIEGSKLPDTVK